MNGKLILEGEEMFEKMQTLKQIEVDAENWLTFYIDEINGDKWVKEYPESEYYGGGAPQLKLLKKFPWEITK